MAQCGDSVARVRDAAEEAILRLATTSPVADDPTLGTLLTLGNGLKKPWKDLTGQLSILAKVIERVGLDGGLGLSAKQCVGFADKALMVRDPVASPGMNCGKRRLRTAAVVPSCCSSPQHSKSQVRDAAVQVISEVYARGGLDFRDYLTVEEDAKILQTIEEAIADIKPPPQKATSKKTKPAKKHGELHVPSTPYPALSVARPNADPLWSLHHLPSCRKGRGRGTCRATCSSCPVPTR